MSVFQNVAGSYWAANLPAIPIRPGTKAPSVENWAAYTYNPISKATQNSWLGQYASHGIGLVMGTELMPGKYLVAVDVDDDRLLSAIKVWAGGTLCAKRGKKGLTIFALADHKPASRQFKLADGAVGIDFLGQKRQTVLPPTIHPDTNEPYTWQGKALLDALAEGSLPVMSKGQVEFLERMVKAPETLDMFGGEGTHDAALKLTAKLVKLESNDERLQSIIAALLPSTYEGNTREELAGMISSAREKGLGSGYGEYDPGDVGPLPQGLTQDGNFVLLTRDHTLRPYTASQLQNPKDLCGIAPRSFWQQNFPSTDDKKGSINGLRAGDALMQACRAKGAFDPARVRGLGVWRENGKIVVNIGQNLPTSDTYVYLNFRGSRMMLRDTPVDGAAVLNFFRQFTWNHASDPVLLFGWAMLAPVCGSLSWRPHMFLTGPKNSGKTTLMNFLSNLIDPLVVCADGQSTEAGIRQRLGPDSLPVLLDEFEADQAAHRLQAIVKLLRSASSSETSVLRGTPEGKALQFSLRSMFLLAAINPIAGSAADESRMVMVELLAHNSDAAAGRTITQEAQRMAEWGPAWCYQSIRHVEAIEPTINALMLEMTEGDTRHRRNMATLLAGAWLGLHGRVPTTQEAATWVAEHRDAIRSRAEQLGEDDASMALNRLLSHQIRDLHLSMTIGQAVVAGQANPSTIEDKNSFLAAEGIRLLAEGVFVANASRGAEAAFRGTRWDSGAWRKALSRLPGAAPSQKPVFLNGMNQRGLILPYELFAKAIAAYK